MNAKHYVRVFVILVAISIFSACATTGGPVSPEEITSTAAPLGGVIEVVILTPTPTSWPTAMPLVEKLADVSEEMSEFVNYAGPWRPIRPNEAGILMTRDTLVILLLRDNGEVFAGSAKLRRTEPFAFRTFGEDGTVMPKHFKFVDEEHFRTIVDGENVYGVRFSQPFILESGFNDKSQLYIFLASGETLEATLDELIEGRNIFPVD